MHACFLSGFTQFKPFGFAPVVALLSLMMPGPESAAAERRSRSDEKQPPVPEVMAPTDPYLAYLDEVAEASSSCKTHAAAVKELLNAQSELVSEYLSADPQARENAQQQLVELTRKIADAESKLAECFGLDFLERDTKLWSPNAKWDREAPAPSKGATRARTAAGQGDEAARQSTTDEVVVTTPPPPPVARSLPAVPPAPEREATYVEFLQSQAGDSTFASEYATDVQKLLAERRQLAVRFLRAPESTRRHLHTVIGAINHRLRISAEAIHEAATLGATG